MWARLKRPPQEDPRMSRGLQLLQSKIAIMENLSDKTEGQFQNINKLIERKTEKLQKIVQKSEEQLARLESAMTKSMDVAEIFQDKIPHEEVIQRKKSVKLIMAARMAHAGHSVIEIAQKVSLPKAQIELICKVNKDELVFDQDNLPDWVRQMEGFEKAPSPKVTSQKKETGRTDIENFVEDAESWVSEDHNKIFSGNEMIGTEEIHRMQQMGDEFKALCSDYNQRQKQLDLEIENNLAKKMMVGAEKVTHTLAATAGTVVDRAGEVMETSRDSLKEVAEKSKVKIKKVKFPKISSEPKDYY